MKCKCPAGAAFIICVILCFVLTSGCVTVKQEPPPPPSPEAPQPLPPPVQEISLSPFTLDILNRLHNEADDFTINQCQFFLSGGIILERNDEEKDQLIDNGSAVFIDNNNRKEIILNEKTEGEAVKILQNKNEIVLPVFFDHDDNNQLVFTAAKNGNSQFFLRFNQQNDPSGAVRGNVTYGGQKYKVKFSGGIPCLMINLTEKKDPIANHFTLSGRRINFADTTDIDPSVYESSVPLTIDMLNRMKKTMGYSINQYQFFLSNTITLERFSTQKKTTVVDGAVILEDNPTSWQITIKERTGGVAIGRADAYKDETELYIAFDQDERNQLVFIAATQDPQSQFFLRFNPLGNPLDDAKGNVEYAGDEYRIRFSGGRPHLRINLRKEGGDTTDQYIVPGRQVGSRRE